MKLLANLLDKSLSYWTILLIGVRAVGSDENEQGLYSSNSGEMKTTDLLDSINNRDTNEFNKSVVKDLLAVHNEHDVSSLIGSLMSLDKLSEIHSAKK